MNLTNKLIVQPCYRLTVDGDKLPAWMYSMITKVSFKETNGDGANETLEINFDDPELQVMESDTFIEKKTSIVCEMGYINDSDYGSVFFGVVETVENDYPVSGKITLKIVARDIGYLMSEGQKTTVWKGKTYSDIVKDICSNYGLHSICDDTCDILERSTSTTTEGTVVEASTPPAQATHTVARGDCLWTIASKFYGNGGMWTKIFDANRGVIKNKDIIYPNQVLTIPDVASNVVQPPAAVVAETKTELTIVNQAGVSDLKFMQNMASICHYKLVIDSAKKTCWFVKPSNKIKELETEGLDYKCGNELLKTFRPKFNDYDRAMSVKSYNLNIENNELVTGDMSQPPVAATEAASSVGAVTPPQTTQTYTVKSGDCLYNIAKKFYSDGSKYTLIFDANRNVIKNKDIIYPNQVLTIP